MPEPILGPKERPFHALTANNLIVEIADSGLKLPNFQRVDGLSRNTETFEVTDGGVGLKYKFHGGVTSYDDVTLVRIMDGSENDKKMSEIVDNFVKTGKKVNATITKFHHGEEILKIYLIGLLFKSEQFPGLDNSNAGAMEMSYPCSIDYWNVEFLAQLPSQ
jgi:hypothetical protein